MQSITFKPPLTELRLTIKRLDVPVVSTHLGSPVDGSNHPRQTQAKEHIHRVAAGDVSDGVISSLLIGGGGFAGEGIRKGGAESDEGDGSDRVKQIDETAEDGGQITDDGRQDGNEAQSHHKGDPAVGVEEVGRRHDGKDYLSERIELP